MVADPRHFNAYPDSFHSNANPDPAFDFATDPDPARHESGRNLRPMLYKFSRALF
jgi:hypothetical protein